MKKIIALGVVAVVAVAGFFLVTSNSNVSNQEFENKVGATIFPIYDIAQQIAGDEFEVVLMLPSGASPHTYDPQPSLLKDLQGAQVVFAIGHGLDGWSSTVAESVEASIVTVDRGIELRETVEEEHGHHDEEHKDEGAHAHEEESGHEHAKEHEDEHGHSHGPIDPHYWLSVHNAKQIAANIANELAELDNENAQLYTDRAEVYAQELEELEVELKNKAADLSNRNIIALHDAWYYFAEEFELNLVGTFEPSAGKEPTPQYLANLEEEVNERNVTTLFMEPQLSSAPIQAFADDNSLNIAVIDPLGGAEGRESYVALMRYNVEQVVEALK